jgi:uncharacterized membrane protein
VQVRFSEALTLLPVLLPGGLMGVTLGCFLTNLVGVFLGTNILGALDVLFGTLATLLAALCTRALANVRVGKGRWAVASALPPVIFNGLIIGAELCWCIMGQWNWGVFIAQGVSVAAGEAVACVLGVLLVHYVETTPRLLAIFRG